MDILNNFSVLGKSTFKDEVKVQKGAVFSGSEVSFNSGVSFKDTVTFTNAPAFPNTIDVANLTVSDTLTSSKTLAASGAAFSSEVVFNEATRFTCSTKPASFTSPINACSVTACTIKADYAEIPEIVLDSGSNGQARIKYGQVNIGDQTEYLLDIKSTSDIEMTAPGQLRFISCAGTIEFFDNKAVEFGKTEAKFSVPFTGSEITGTAFNANVLTVTGAANIGGATSVSSTFDVEGATQLKSDTSIFGKATVKGGLKLEKSTNGNECLDSAVVIKAPSLVLNSGCVSSAIEIDTDNKNLKIGFTTPANAIVFGDACKNEMTFTLDTGKLDVPVAGVTEFTTDVANIETSLNLKSAFNLNSDADCTTSTSVFNIIDTACFANQPLTVEIDVNGKWGSTETIAFKSYVEAELCAAKEAFKAPDGTSPAKYESATNPALAADEFTFDVVLNNAYSATPVMQIVDKNGTVKYADLKYNGARGDGKQTITVGLLHEGTVAKDEYKLIVFGI